MEEKSKDKKKRRGRKKDRALKKIMKKNKKRIGRYHYVKKSPDRVDLGAGTKSPAGPQATVLNGESGGSGWKEQEKIRHRQEETGPNPVENPNIRCGKTEAKVKFFRNVGFITNWNYSNYFGAASSNPVFSENGGS